MPRVASFLAALLLLLTFNAYACILPLPTADQMGCDSPSEQQARQTCDAFLEMGPHAHISSHGELPILKALEFDTALQSPPYIPLLLRYESPPCSADTPIHLSIPTTVLRI